MAGAVAVIPDRMGMDGADGVEATGEQPVTPLGRGVQIESSHPVMPAGDRVIPPSQPVASSSMRYPEKLLSPDEVIVSQFRPHWSGILKEGVLSVLVLVLVGLVAVLDTGWGWWVVLALVGAWLALVAPGLVRWWTSQHVITSERVIHRMGLIAKTGKEIPLEVINDIAFSQKAWERVLGTGDLPIESAGTHGQSRYSDVPRPEQVQSLIYQVRERRMLELEAGPPTGGESVAGQLATLARLHDQGKLTDDEFEKEKRRLLGGSDAPHAG